MTLAPWPYKLDGVGAGDETPARVLTAEAEKPKAKGKGRN
jgi:hypothetical protein